MRRGQTKTQSLIEQIFGQLATLAVAVVTAEMFVYDAFGISVTMTQNISIMTYLAAQNILIRYFIRRYFEHKIITSNNNNNSSKKRMPI